MPKTTQIEMREFISSIDRAELQAKQEEARGREFKALVKKHGTKRAGKILSNQLIALEALVNMTDDQAIARWEARRRSGSPLPLDPR